MSHTTRNVPPEDQDGQKPVHCENPRDAHPQREKPFNKILAPGYAKTHGERVQRQIPEQEDERTL